MSGGSRQQGNGRTQQLSRLRVVECDGLVLRRPSLCRATSWLMYAVGFVAAAQVIGVDIAPLVAVGEQLADKLDAAASALNTCPPSFAPCAQRLQLAFMDASCFIACSTWRHMTRPAVTCLAACISAQEEPAASLLVWRHSSC